MKKRPRSFLWSLLVLGILLPSRLAASVEYDAKIPQLVFAAQELNDALKEAGREIRRRTILKRSGILNSGKPISMTWPAIGTMC